MLGLRLFSHLKSASVSLDQHRAHFQEGQKRLNKIDGYRGRVWCVSGYPNLHTPFRMNCFLCSEAPCFTCDFCKEDFCSDCEFGLPIDDSRSCVKCGITEAETKIHDLEEKVEDIECELDDIKDEDEIDSKREEQEDLRSEIQELETAKEEAEDRLEILVMRFKDQLAEAKRFFERLEGR